MTGPYSAPQPWEQAWAAALYGPAGFYRQSAPAGHFTTSAHGSPGVHFARALIALGQREGLETVVDFGAGRGELLEQLAAQSDSLHLVGVDVVGRPADLSARCGWLQSPGGARVPDLSRYGAALVVANEWLDVVPCPVVELHTDGSARYVLVDEVGREELGAVVDGADAEWLSRWWPLSGPPAGVRAEVGRPRDEAYAALVAASAPGSLVVAIDYGHLRQIEKMSASRPPAGTLVGYRGGAQVPPVPDGSCDLTAHVAMDSLAADRLIPQRIALRELGIRGELPAYEQARQDPAGYLAALADASAQAALTGPGLGDFWWALRRVPT